MGKVSKYCGNKTGQNVNVTGDKVEIRFSSNDKTEERGYVLKFTLDSLASDSRGKWDHKETDRTDRTKYTKFISHLNIY